MSEHYIDGGDNIPMERSEESVTAFTMRRIRAEIIEECAKVADGFTCGGCGMDGKAGAAIRALVGKAGDTP